MSTVGDRPRPLTDGAAAASRIFAKLRHDPAGIAVTLAAPVVLVLVFGYVFGSAIAGTGVGWIADRWGWDGVFVTMVVCCVLTIGFSAMTLGHRAESAGRR